MSISFISTSSEDFFIPVSRPTQKRNTSLREAGFYAPHQSLSTVFFLNFGNNQTRFQNQPATPQRPQRRPGSTLLVRACQPAFVLFRKQPKTASKTPRHTLSAAAEGGFYAPRQSLSTPRHRLFQMSSVEGAPTRAYANQHARDRMMKRAEQGAPTRAYANQHL